MPTHWAAGMGGAEYQCKLLCKHLVEDGRFEVHWLSIRTKSGYVPQDYSLHRFSRPRRFAARSYFLDGASLKARLDEIQPQVIYQRGGSGLTRACAHWARTNGARMVWNAARDDDFFRPRWSMQALRKPMSWIDRQLACRGVALAQYVVVQRAEQQRWLQEQFGREDAVLIPNFHPQPGPEQLREPRPTVLWIANLKPTKRPERFLELARRLADTPAQFVMIGRASEDAGFMAQFDRDRAMLTNLRYLGALQQTEVNDWLARSHLLVNTSDIEGFSNTFIQAWMRGVPVLTFMVNPDGLLREGGYGLCADGDAVRLEVHARRFLSDSPWREEMGARSRTFSIARFGSGNADRLVRLMLGDAPQGPALAA